MALEISSGQGLLSVIFASQYQRKTVESKMEYEPLSEIENKKADLVLLTKIYQYFMNDYYSVDGEDQLSQKFTGPLFYEQWELIDELFDELIQFPRNEAQTKGILFLIKTMEGFASQALADVTEFMKAKEKLNPECGMDHDPNKNLIIQFSKLIILIDDPPVTEDRGEFCTIAQILTIGLLACQIKPCLIPCSDIDYVVMDKILSLGQEAGEMTQADKSNAYSKLIKIIFEQALEKAETAVVILDINPDFTKMEEFRDIAAKTGYPVIELSGIVFNKSLKRKRAVRDLLHYVFDTLGNQKFLNGSGSVNPIKDEWKRELYPANHGISNFKQFQNFDYHKLLETIIDEKNESVIRLAEASKENVLKQKYAQDTFQYLQNTYVSKHLVKYEKNPQPRLFCRRRIQQCISSTRSFGRHIQQYICLCWLVNRVAGNQKEVSNQRELRTGVFIYDEDDDLV